MTIRLVTGTLEADTSSIRIRASVSVVSPVLGVVVQLPVSKIDYLELQVGAYLDNSGLYRYIKDLAVLTDSARYSFSKRVFDSAVIVDAPSFSVSKPRSDSVAPSDLFNRVVAYVRSFSEQYGLTDAQQLQVAKAVSDAVVSSESMSRSFSKALFDGVAMNDLAEMLDGITFQAVKSVMNVVFAGDEHSIVVDRPLSDEQVVVDTPSLEPQLPKADEFSVSDESFNHPHKFLFDFSELSDFATRVIDKAASDLALLIDSVAIDVSRPLSTDFTAVDSSALGVQKPAASDFTTFDEQLLDFTKSSQSQVVAQEEIRFDSFKQLLEEVFADELHSIQLSTPASSDFSVSDSSLLAISRLIEDGVAMNDSAEADDGLLLQYIKAFSNVAFATDSATLSGVLAKSHQVSVPDSGLLVNQNYCEDYFAEDYVGVSRNF